MRLQTTNSSTDIQLICFRLGTEEYGLNIMQIKEIIHCQKITPIPKSPSFIEGVINLRGMIIPIIDLRKRFELTPEISPKRKIIIAQVESKIVGLIVDDVTDIITISSDSFLPTPAIVRGIEADYLYGMANTDRGLLLIINLDKILTAEEKGSLDLPVLKPQPEISAGDLLK